MDMFIITANKLYGVATEKIIQLLLNMCALMGNHISER